MDMMKMGAFLQELRKEKRLTQEQLGEALHISSKTISRWETGAYMPPVEMLLALSELYGLTINELVRGERLAPDALPQAADENLAAALKENAAFQLEERRDFWRKKWQTDHRWTLALLIVLFCIASLAGLLFNLLWVNIAASLIAMGAAVYLRNHKDGYVEHHLYDEMLE